MTRNVSYSLPNGLYFASDNVGVWEVRDGFRYGVPHPDAFNRRYGSGAWARIKKGYGAQLSLIPIRPWSARVSVVRQPTPRTKPVLSQTSGAAAGSGLPSWLPLAAGAGVLWYLMRR